MRNSLCLAWALGAATIAAAPASAEFRYTNESGGFVLLYGQINPSYASVDDGVSSYGNFADSDTSSSRIGLRAEQPVAG